jgi:hypothetical protein
VSAHRKLIHRGDKVNPLGGVSALCCGRPVAINLKVASWTLSDAAVTCPRCLMVMAAGKAEAAATA